MRRADGHLLHTLEIAFGWMMELLTLLQTQAQVYKEDNE